MNTYRDIYNELSRLQAIAIRLAAFEDKNGRKGKEAEIAFELAAADTRMLRKKLEAEVAKNLIYMQPRQGHVVSIKGNQHEPEPAIEFEAVPAT